MSIEQILQNYFSKHSKVSLQTKVRKSQEVIGLSSSACIVEDFAISLKYTP